MKKYSFLLIFIFLILPISVSSQTRVEEQISIEYSPKYPGPNENVSVYLESFQIDLDKSDINYYINGQLVSGGPGQKDFIFSTGPLGEVTNLLVEITKQNGQVVERNYIINPGDIDLYYEAETYTPPFYKGKSEYTTQSVIKLVAVSNFSDGSGDIIPDDQVVYTWKINGSVDGRSSGLGRNVYHYQSGIISRPLDVILEASPSNSDQKARVIETISPTEPEILVYEKNPIYGTIFTQNVDGNLTLSREELELEAVPYGFSNDILRNGTFEWFLNGNKIDNFRSNNIVFRRINNEPSNNNVTVEVRHGNKILQSLRYNFGLNFGAGGLDFNF